MKAFDRLHPAVCVFFFAAIIFITMLTVHPIIVGLSLFGAIIFCMSISGLRATAKSLAYSLPVLLIIAITNPLFVHKGETVLFFLFDLPITQEAILYGFSAAAMIMAVFYWFKCFHIIMTSDKFIYLFGQIAPKLSLVLSMTLNFVPKFKRIYRETEDAQRALGAFSTKGYFSKLAAKFRILLVVIGRGLENSVQTADSMRARGYGLKGRSNYSIFTFTKHDTFICVLIVVLTAAVCFFLGKGFGAFVFYPNIGSLMAKNGQIIFYILLGVLAFLPTLLETEEKVAWLYLKSKI